MRVAADRRVKILERVADGISIEVAELARDFAPSEITIRRDSQRWECDGFLRRTYGGAAAHLTRAVNLAFNARALAHAREKRLIGLTAARLVGDAQLFFVGIGTTAEQFARYLPARPDVTVVPGSLPIASLLGTRTSGVVVGAGGLTARRGISDLNDEEAEIHRLAIEHSAQQMVIADGSNLGLITPVIVAPVNHIGTLVTDASAAAAEVDALRDRGERVVLATERI